MNDYQRVIRLILYLDEKHTEQPDLTTLAEYLGLSLPNFHRLLFAWAGIKPADFLHCLTLSHAKKLLGQGKSTLDISPISRSSNPGCRSDLRVNLETAYPGELESGGKGWTISCGFTESPFGRCLVGESHRGICHLSFVDSKDGLTEWAALQENWPQARLYQNDSSAARLADMIFMHPSQNHSRPVLRAFVQGTAFQIKVWQALLHVPPGTLVSYGHLAAALGQANAARAVGTAVGRNSLAYLIPCHRVISASGATGGYRWGQARKRAIITWENTAPSSRQHRSGTPA